MKHIIIATDKAHLKKLIEENIKLNGNLCDLNNINVSNLKDMGFVFCDSEFNGDISEWDVSNVIDMSSLFFRSKFNGDISKWDVSSVKDMRNMFAQSKFNNNLSEWKPYHLEDFTNMFIECQAATPYWSNIENKEQRVKAIDNYALAQYLQKNLSDNLVAEKKIKI